MTRRANKPTSLAPLLGLVDGSGSSDFRATRRWIVELIFNLVGYTADRDLAVLRAVEPSCGSGAFLGPMVERLIGSCRSHGRDITTAHAAIHATDVLPDNVAAAREVVRELLADAGVAPKNADDLVQTWINTGDCLLAQPEHEGLFGPLDNPPADFVIGNPPYIRPEDVPTRLYDSYRRACSTMLGRADVYVGFFEAAAKPLPRWRRGVHLRRPLDAQPVRARPAFAH